MATTLTKIGAAAASERAEWLDELRDELAIAWQRGEQRTLEAYNEQLHAARVTEREMCALLEAEITARRSAGDQPTYDEYARRYPQFAAALAVHFDHAPTACIDHSSILPAIAPPNRTLPGYELQSLLGRGGMGVVYKAIQLGLNRPVALKMVLAGRLAGADELARFRREAEAVAALNHPNIVRVYDIGEEDGTPYLALEFVAGGTLAQALALRGRLEPRQAASLAEAIARGAHEAHTHGIVHRDLKPANILLEAPDGNSGLGTPKITDFGIAKRSNETRALTETGMAAGTPQYMAPEQALPLKHCPITGQADVYSIGVILYELLTLHTPFEGEHPVEVLQRVINQPPPPPSRFNPNIPRDLETIILKCLEKQPHLRYPTAHALAEDLARWQAGKPISARPVRSWERGVRWAQRNPVVAGLLATVFGVLTVGSIVATTFALRERDAAAKAHTDRNRALQATKHAEDMAAHAANSLHEANTARAVEVALRQETARRELVRARELYAADMNIVYADWQSGQLRNSQQLLDKYRPNHPDAPRPGFEWHYLQRLCNAYDMLHSVPNPVKDIVPTADPNIVTLIQKRLGTILQVDPPKVLGTWALPQPNPHPFRTVCYAPRGGTLACLFEGPLLELRHESQLGKVVHTLTISNNEYHMPMKTLFTADGKTLYVAVGSISSGGIPGYIVAYDVATGKEQRRFTGCQAGVNDLALIADEKVLVSVEHSGYARVWDTATAQERRHIEVPGHAVAVAATADGRLFAVGTSNGAVHLVDGTTMQVKHVLHDHADFVRRIAFNHDGSLLTVCSYESFLRVWNTKDGKLHKLCRGHMDVVNAFCYHPKQPSQVLSVGDDGQALRWDIATSSETITTYLPRFEMNNLLRRRDPKQILVADSWRICQPIDLSTNKLGDDYFIPDFFAMTACKTLAPDDTTLALAVVNHGIFTFSLTKGAPPVQLKTKCWQPTCLAYSPDGKYLVAGDAFGNLHILSTTNQEPARFIKAYPTAITSLRFLPNQANQFATTSQNGTAQLWDLTTGKLVRPLYHSSHSAHKLTFTANGERFALARGDGVTILGATATGQVILELKGHTKQVNFATFDTTEQRLLTGSNDRTARLWDVATGRTTLVLRDHDSYVIDGLFSSDGQKIVTLGHVGVKIWDASPAYTAEAGRLFVLGTQLRNAQIKHKDDGTLATTFTLANTSKQALPIPQVTSLRQQLSITIRGERVGTTENYALAAIPITFTQRNLEPEQSLTGTATLPAFAWPPGDYTVTLGLRWGNEPTHAAGEITTRLTISQPATK